MEDWFDQLSSRANALKTDEELRLECSKLAGPGPDARSYKSRLETFLTDRAEIKRIRTAKHRKAPFDAQKDKFRERDQ